MNDLINKYEKELKAKKKGYSRSYITLDEFSERQRQSYTNRE